MKALHSIQFSALALVAGISAPAIAEPPPVQPPQQAPIMAGPGDGAAGPINQVNRPDGFSLSSSTPGSTAVAPQTATPQPMDSASGLATGRRTYEPVAGVQPQGISETNKILDVARTSPPVDASPGAGKQWIGGSDDGQSIRKKRPRRNRDGTRGRRMHKP